MDNFFMRIQKANAAAGYKKRLFSVDFADLDFAVYVWAWSVSDAIRMMCPNMDASYSDIQGKGDAYPRGWYSSTQIVYFDEVRENIIKEVK